VLPSGPLPPNPSELLGSQRMAQLIEELGSFADVILFDTPPVLACADAMVLASRMDGVLLVVDSRSTRREAATRALEMLRNVDARVLGGILNKVRARSSDHYYYYYSNEEKSEKGVMGRWLKRDRRERRTLERSKVRGERDASV
jgi:capsular exopolysaccharide synthesis family protein